MELGSSMSSGYRGYISTNMQERSVPQSVQQMVIREYCKKNDLKFLLSATEYNMKDSIIVLRSTLREKVAGVVFYSIFQLPQDSNTRVSILRGALRARKRVHFAAENIKIRSRAGIANLEDIFLLRGILND